jgi:putative FmdB family regulatory protein
MAETQITELSTADETCAPVCRRAPAAPSANQYLEFPRNVAYWNDVPTYEYVCSKCEHHFETVQRITDKPLTVCPKELCHLKRWGKGKVKRAVVGGAGLLFKGSGFYITDYRSDSYKADAKKDASPAAAAKTESKSTDSAAAKTTAAAPAATPKPPAAKSD